MCVCDGNNQVNTRLSRTYEVLSGEIASTGREKGKKNTNYYYYLTNITLSTLETASLWGLSDPATVDMSAIPIQVSTSER